MAGFVRISGDIEERCRTAILPTLVYGWTSAFYTKLAQSEVITWAQPRLYGLKYQVIKLIELSHVLLIKPAHMLLYNLQNPHPRYTMETAIEGAPIWPSQALIKPIRKRLL